MTDVAIRCEGLAKQYWIGERESYKTIRDVITDAFASPFRRFRSALRHSSNGSAGTEKPNIWALKDVSFEIKRGEVVGIIGRNGAGKSTLLKILSRITEPTHGHADIWGRVGSLLEVGTGFHPELTGRDNIFLNGAILGMRRAEIARKFDEIVAFADVEKFIDTPVKRYSSGMYVRLAFSVAAHMETEILLVDEVLAVGDAQFQKKCFERMQAVSSEGRTILFVSHNLAAMRTICRSGIALDHGDVAARGEINEVVDGYLARLSEDVVGPQFIELERFILERAEIASADGSVIKTFDEVTVRIRFRAKVDLLVPGAYVGFLTLEHERIAGLDFRDFLTAPRVAAGDACELSFTIRDFPLLAGEYQLEIHLEDMGDHHVKHVPQMFRFSVVETPVYGGHKLDSWFGHVALDAVAHVGATPVSAGENRKGPALWPPA
jgi:ABC-type polysaccharide/polyol phosphate transport system ATPase subunit